MTHGAEALLLSAEAPQMFPADPNLCGQCFHVPRMGEVGPHDFPKAAQTRIAAVRTDQAAGIGKDEKGPGRQQGRVGAVRRLPVQTGIAPDRGPLSTRSRRGWVGSSEPIARRREPAQFPAEPTDRTDRHEASRQGSDTPCRPHSGSNLRRRRPSPTPRYRQAVDSSAARPGQTETWPGVCRTCQQNAVRGQCRADRRT